VLRLAPLGLVTAPELLTLGLGLDRSALPMVTRSRDAMSRLATIGRFELDDLVAASWRRTDRSVTVGNRDVPFDWLVADRRRVAPGVLREDGNEPWVRSLWQLRALPCDPNTGERLIDTCVCGSPLFWSNALSVTGCQFCGADISKSEPEYVSENDHKRVQEFSRLFRHPSRVTSLPAPFDDVHDRTLFAAMSWLGTMNVDPQAMPQPEHAVSGYELLKEWPAGFDRLIREQISDLHGRRPSAPIAAIEASIHRTDERALKEILLARMRVVLGAPLAPDDLRF